MASRIKNQESRFKYFLNSNKFILSGIVHLSLCASIASAGTMGNIGVETDSWNGLYFGVNGGGGIATDKVTQSMTYSTTAFSNNVLLSTQSRYSLTGGEFGGQVGYNFQRSSWLIGAEGDMDWASLGSSSSNYCAPSATTSFYNGSGNGLGYCLNNKPKINNLGTIRGRLGYIIKDVLWYATAGGAWSSVKNTFTPSFGPTVSASLPQQPLFLPTSGSFSSTRAAWTVGGGVEAKLWGHFSAKTEYLYVNYGRINNTFPLAVNPAFGSNYTAGSVALVNTSSSMASNIIRVGINYRV